MPTRNASVNLRTVANRVGLAPCSVSAVLNNTPASQAIPQRTKDRVFQAAKELNYRPNLWARSLRTKRTRMVMLFTSDLARPAIAQVAAGVQKTLHRSGYLLALGTSPPSNSGLEADNSSLQLTQRGIEGVIAIDAKLASNLDLPIASVELDYMSLAEPLSNEMRMWLTELGRSAAEGIIQAIEKDSPRRTVKMAAKFPQAHVAPSRVGLGVPIDVRESA